MTNDGLEVALDGTTLEKTASGLRVNSTFKPTSAGSADTLTNTRTLWGQNFNGGANVTGALETVGNITFNSADVTIASGDANDRDI